MEVYQFPLLQRGKLIKRYKRFFADIELDTGEIITAHCANTGPMTGICYEGNPVQVSYNPSPKRKLAYSWEMIEIDNTWVGINTALPNRVVKILLEQKLIPELSGYDQVRSEVVYGKDNRSRIDFLLTGGDRPIYVEVKNTTWTKGTMALFPDTETTRGQKHLRELIDILPHCRGVMLYFINRSDVEGFTSGDQKDPTYGELLRSAYGQGLEILPCKFNITPESINYLGLVKYFDKLTFDS
jgi:sugar fermentation stimulation protein A